VKVLSSFISRIQGLPGRVSGCFEKKKDIQGRKR
jgi:hypothetical protein